MLPNTFTDKTNLPPISEDDVDYLIEDILYSTLKIKQWHYIMQSYLHERGLYAVDQLLVEYDTNWRFWELHPTVSTIVDYANLLPYAVNREIARRHVFLCILFGVIDGTGDYGYDVNVLPSDKIPQQEYPQLNDIVFCQKTIECFQNILGAGFFNESYNIIVINLVNLVNKMYGYNISIADKLKLCGVSALENKCLGTWDSWYFGNTGSMLQKFKHDWKLPKATRDNACNCQIFDDDDYIATTPIDYDLVPTEITVGLMEHDVRTLETLDVNDYPSYIRNQWHITPEEIKEQNTINILSYTDTTRKLKGFITNAIIDSPIHEYDYDYNEEDEDIFDDPNYKQEYINKNLSEIYSNFTETTLLKLRCEKIKNTLGESSGDGQQNKINDRYIYHEFVNQVEDIIIIYGRERRQCFNYLYRVHCLLNSVSRQTAFNQMKSNAYYNYKLIQCLLDLFYSTDEHNEGLVYKIQTRIDIGYTNCWIWDYDAGYNIDELVRMYKLSNYIHPEEYCESARQFYENCLNDCIKSGQMSFSELVQLTRHTITVNELIEKTTSRKPVPDVSNKPSQPYKRPPYQKTKTPADPIRNIEDIQKIKDYFLSYGKKSLRRRNYTIFCLGISTGLRASDLLTLKVGDVFKDSQIVDEIVIHEKKTGNITHTNLNSEIKDVLFKYLQTLDEIDEDAYLFSSQSSYGYLQVKTLYDMFDKAQTDLNLPFHFSTHSLRKTFAYWTIRMHYYDQNIIFSLQDMLNHRDIKNTLYYSGHTKDHLKTLYDDMGKVLTGNVEDTPAISSQEQKINQILDMLSKQLGDNQNTEE